MITKDVLTHEREYSEYDISHAEWSNPKPHGLSGCFRLKDEDEYMMAAIESHMPWLDEAVLVLQPSTDMTHRFAAILEERYGPERVRLFSYPFPVAQIDTPDHYKLPENSVFTLMHFTNWALSRCRYSWVAKIEGDVMAMPSFGRIREEIDAHPTREMYYGRVGLNVAGTKCEMIPFQNVRNAGWDEGVFNNSPRWPCVRYGKWESIDMNGPMDPRHNFGWSFFHTKRSKRRHVNRSETWVPRTEEHVRAALSAFNTARAWPSKEEEYPSILWEWKP